MSEVPNRAEPDSRAVEGLSIKSRDEKNEPDGGTSEGTEGFVQDQRILAPEIMNKILKHLDLRALKEVRLVCKSWLVEAQSHIEKRGIIRMGGYESGPRTVHNFMALREKKILALPQPFLFIHFRFNFCSESGVYEQEMSMLSSLCPPLVITRFSTSYLPLKLALPLIIQCSSSLEYLELFAHNSGGSGSILPESQGVKFQNLRQLVLDATVYFSCTENWEAENSEAEKSGGENSDAENSDAGNCKSENLDAENLESENWDDFPLVISWIMKASPKVNVFEITAIRGADDSMEIANEVLLQVDVGNVTTLALEGFELEPVTLEHFASMSFSKLENLRLELVPGYGGETEHETLLVTIVTKAAATLRTLEASLRPDPEFPICPNVQVLELRLFPGWNGLVSRSFPSLRELDASVGHLRSMDVQHVFPASPPLIGIKTLSLLNLKYNSGYSGFGPMAVFKTFPALQCLYIHVSFLLEYWRLKTSGDPGFVDLLQGIKLLALEANGYSWYDPDLEAGYSLLAELKGLENLTVRTFNEVFKIPFGAMPGLKVLQIYWDCDNFRMEQLLEIARGVKKGMIINCCSILRDESWSRLKCLLKTFFDSAPNAVCGCKYSPLSL